MGSSKSLKLLTLEKDEEKVVNLITLPILSTFSTALLYFS